MTVRRINRQAPLGAAPSGVNPNDPLNQRIAQIVAAILAQSGGAGGGMGDNPSQAVENVPTFDTAARIPFWYLVSSGVLTSSSSIQQTLIFQTDSFFELHSVFGVSTLDAATDYHPNNFSVQLTDQASGRQLSSNRIPQSILCSPSNMGYRLTYPVKFPPGANLLCDFLNLSGSSSNTVSLVLNGYKVFVG